MIPIQEIKRALTSLLKKTEDIDVFYTRVEKSEGSENIDRYFHVALIPISTELFGKLMRDRAFFVDVSYINDHADANTFYAWFERMDAVVLPYVQIADRSITVGTASSKIVDEIGHYTFTLKFRDVVENVQDGEPAKDLTIRFK